MATVARRRRRAASRDVEEAWAQTGAQEVAGRRSLLRPLREYAELIPEPTAGPLRFDDFPFQEEWYSPEIGDAEEVIWMKSSQVGMCLAPSTRVLTADLRWVPIDGVRPGQALVAVDEQAVASVGRKLRTAVVQARWDVVKPACRITMSDGTEIVATPEHRFLGQHDTRRPGRVSDALVCPVCERPFKSVVGVSTHLVRAHAYRPGHNRQPPIRWMTVRELAVGDRIRSVADVWDDPGYEDGWFGGMLDGEGHMASAGSEHSLRKRAAGVEAVVSQQLGPVYDRAAAYLGNAGITFNEQLSQRPNGHLPVGRLSITRTRDLLRLIGVTRPSKYVDVPWWVGMRLPGRGRSDVYESWPSVVAIEPIGKQRMVDLQTSEATFIAEGLVSHNSAFAWRWAVRQVDQLGNVGLYIFPTETHVREFGDERIEPAIEESPYLQSRILARFVRHKALKRIGRGFLHLRGSNSKAGAQSVAAQFIVFDEYDHLDQVNLPQIERRISGARQLGLTPRIRRLGNPTVDGDGIAAAFQSSDRRLWMVRCEVCDLEQEISWEESVRWQNRRRGPVMRAGHDEFEDPTYVEKVWRACKACDSELDVKLGRWVATNPGARMPGYHVPRLIVPMTDLKAIVVASRRTKPQDVEAFENLDLGRPYSSAEAMLDQATLLAAAEMGGPLLERYMGRNPVTMGVDVAGERDLSVRIDEQLPAPSAQLPNPRRALWIGEVKDFAALQDLIERFKVQVVAIDDNPERRMAKALRSSYAPGRVVLVHYNAKNDSEPLVVKTGERGTPLEGVPLSVTVNRTEAIDSMMDSFRQRRNFPLKDPPPKWFDQMRSLKRRVELDSKGRANRVYVTTGTVGDDYAHADVYALVATELLRMRGGVRVIAEQQKGRRLPDEEMGFRRVRLSGDDVADQWQPGFGGEV